MTYAIAIVVFLVLPALAVVARIAAHHRYGPHGRSDVEWGRTRDVRPAEGLAHDRHARLHVRGEASDSQAGTKDRRATLRPVFNLGATPAPEGVSPWASDEDIRREFGLDTPDHRGQAA